MYYFFLLLKCFSSLKTRYKSIAKMFINKIQSRIDSEDQFINPLPRKQNKPNSNA